MDYIDETVSYCNDGNFEAFARPRRLARGHISMVSTIHIDAIHIWAVSVPSLSKQEWHNHVLTGTKPSQVHSIEVTIRFRPDDEFRARMPARLRTCYCKLLSVAK
ncbi:hypothetical protein GLUCOINTEAF2_0201991 [Komagataeibacter intermedius AF2]|uniref:Uncharacterized protein n=1 Tax=Komagataeibacter intermedius AF2 TaxID=1458464 RepID=A0A0N1FCD3_9PROT|nr:hypothetical protein GLUCOINTEAF2_0201991 [Komagataeibacter intermedius AF2]